MSAKRRVCIIGAGTAGLCALKNSLAHDMDAVAYEQSDEVGGTWVYNENTERESVPYGLVHELHSSMYEGLHTNLPKEVMCYPDFPYPEHLKESFVSAQEVLKFLQSYAEHFNLQSHIKLQHSVIRVRPRRGEWELYVWDILNDRYDVVYFDYIFVCNGHYTTPLYPHIEGMNVYRGRQLHSHFYRKASTFKDAKVLIMGCGPSGMDICNHIHRTASQIYLSHHLKPDPDTTFMPNVIQKPDVLRFTEDGAEFKDGSSEKFNFIIYCTGYKYSFPFLSTDCGVRVEDNFVQPLYKHCININYPSMALIGLPFKVCPTQVFDLQVRFALKFYTNEREFPSRQEMLDELEQDTAERREKGLNNRRAHEMGERQFDYYKQLSEIAGIENIKPVITKIMEDCSCKYIFELEHYRKSCFKIIDDENYVKFNDVKTSVQ